jgi:asparagine synthase (glutamine-hydrolysing)
LKQAVRNVIPDEIIERRKQGFGVPIREWFSGQFGEVARREISDFCSKTDFLDQSAVMKLIQTGNGAHAWILLNFALWWKQFIEGKSPSAVNSAEALAAARYM